MRSQVTYLLLVLLSFVGACASSYEEPVDGQTHWMERCTNDNACGDLSCVCGVCTEACSSDAPCELSGAECRSTASTGATCDTAASAMRVCVPSCERQADCDALGAELMCSDDAICALPRMMVERDSSTPEPDGGERNDGGPEPAPAAVQVACAEGGELTGERFEIVATGSVEASLACAPDGTLYAIHRGDGQSSGLAKIEDGGARRLTEQLTNVQRFAMDGDSLLVGMSDGSEVSIAELDRASEDVTYLAREASNNVAGIASDSDAVYWITDVSQDPWLGRLFRSPREPGESQVLADLDGQPGTDLVRIGDRLLLIALVDGIARLHSVSTTASDDVEVLNDAPTDIAGMVTDGTTFFVSRATPRDALGNVTGTGSVGMIDLETQAYRELFETGQRSPWGLVLGGEHIYWVLDEVDEIEGQATRSIWRGRKDGTGEAQKLADVIGWSDVIAVHDGYLYWLSACRLQPEGHIVRIPLP